jgi:hypothetical protein
MNSAYSPFYKLFHKKFPDKGLKKIASLSQEFPEKTGYHFYKNYPLCSIEDKEATKVRIFY